MKNRLFVIGNGFDLAHNLPTAFDPDFKNIANKIEPAYFWDIYQSRKDEIWSDFENLLGCPDFNNLEQIFDGFEPDYLAESESARDDIIFQSMVNGHLQDVLREFAENAERSLTFKKRKIDFEQLLDLDAYYISFNYTHVLEKLYNIPTYNVLHIHGEVGNDNLILGYPEGNFTPEKYRYDATLRGHYVETTIQEYISNIDDIYVRKAYEHLYDKCKSFSKKPRISCLEFFLENVEINEIIVYGHSCAIDFEYFDFLNVKYPNAVWVFYTNDEKQEINVKNLQKKCGIEIVSLEKCFRSV